MTEASPRPWIERLEWAVNTSFKPSDVTPTAIAPVPTLNPKSSAGIGSLLTSMRGVSSFFRIDSKLPERLDQRLKR